MGEDDVDEALGQRADDDEPTHPGVECVGVKEGDCMTMQPCGNVAQMMDSIAGFYDEELARWIDWFTKLFEPLLMLFIGLVIGVVVLLLYMPIFELAGQIQ